MTTPKSAQAAAYAALISERSSSAQADRRLSFEPSCVGRLLKDEAPPRHYLKRLAFRLADRAALRRAELRARAFGVIAADRLNRGGAA
ncbi:hypothetical protein Lcho_2192 [Leptothrix cholodnii SP-6]|uniref:Uncharacterized protein n=2 Tax=Leptothrix cholodnii TaxID=34029 RepID=B1Y3D0_LEPCP|nr:hypothetical protein Lcho_2192 [Leptothrix cholodnii SP-6]